MNYSKLSMDAWKPENMKIHLLFVRGNYCTTGASFVSFTLTSSQTGYHGVSNYRYGLYLSTDTP